MDTKLVCRRDRARARWLMAFNRFTHEPLKSSVLWRNIISFIPETPIKLGHVVCDGNVSCFSRDGQYIASATGGNIYVQTLWSGQVVHRLHHDGVTVECLDFSPDGEHIASAGENSIRVWSMRSGHLEHEVLQGLWGVRSLCFSPDGEHLVSTMRGGRPRGRDVVRLWSVRRAHP